MAQALTRSTGTRLARTGNGHGAQALPLFEPRADVMETGEAFLLQIEMPAVRPEDMDVTVDRNVLTVRGRGTPVEEEGLTPLYSEFGTGTFERTFHLAEEIDRDRIEARHQDGLLALVLPKTEGARARRIAIKRN